MGCLKLVIHFEQQVLLSSLRKRQRLEESRQEPYASDVCDNSLHFALPHLMLMRTGTQQRHHALREIFDALRWLMRIAARRVYMSHEFPARITSYQSARHWVAVVKFATPTHELSALLRIAASGEPESTTVIRDSRTLQLTLTSGGYAAHDGTKRKRGETLHVAVYIHEYLPTPRSTPVDSQGRAQIAALLATGVRGHRQSPRHHLRRSGLHRDRIGNCGRVAGRGAGGRYSPADEAPLFAAVQTTGHRTPLRLAYQAQTVGARLRVDHSDAHRPPNPSSGFPPPRAPSHPAIQVDI